MPLRAFRQGQSGEEVIQIALRLGLLSALIFWCFVIVRPFIGILAWSVVLAVALHPLQAWLSDHLGQRPTFAAAIVTVLAAATRYIEVTLIPRDHGARSAASQARQRRRSAVLIVASHKAETVSPPSGTQRDGATFAGIVRSSSPSVAKAGSR